MVRIFIVLLIGMPLGCTTLSEDISDAMRTIAPPSPGEAARWLQDEDPDRRREGTLLLANAPFGGEPQYLELYRRFAQFDENPLVRAAAVRAVARNGEVSDARLLADRLRDESRHVRWEAARGLQRLHDPSVISNLIEIMRDDAQPPEIRMAVADALGQYPDHRVFNALVIALNARELSVNLAASGSLQVMTGEDFGLDPRRWLTWYNTVSGDQFAGGVDYLYPVYRRDTGFFERLIFWARRVEEQPGPPVGMPSRRERRTYDDDFVDGDGGDDGGGADAGTPRSGSSI